MLIAIGVMPIVTTMVRLQATRGFYGALCIYRLPKTLRHAFARSESLAANR